MKNIPFVFLFAMISFSAYGQIEFGIKAGLSSYQLAQGSISIPSNQSTLSIQNADYGHHFGIYTRAKVAAIYVEPAILFNSNTVTYKLDQYGEFGSLSTFKNEKYNTVDIPVLIGLKFGFLRIQAGAVSHIFINTISDLVDVKGYEQRFQKATYGYQAGLGIDIWKLRFDLNYEGNLTKFGDHITVGGNEYSFGERPKRLIATVGYKF